MAYFKLINLWIPQEVAKTAQFMHPLPTVTSPTAQEQNQPFHCIGGIGPPTFLRFHPFIHAFICACRSMQFYLMCRCV